MNENNNKNIIRGWYKSHMKGNFAYYISSLIFIIMFVYIFYSNIHMSSLWMLVLLSLVPAILAFVLSCLLFRGYFLVFFGSFIFIIPGVVTAFIVYTMVITPPALGYVLYTNNLTGKCDLDVLDYKNGMPWFATKGCMLTEKNRDTIVNYFESGAGVMRKQNACEVMKDSATELRSMYSEISSKYPDFSVTEAVKSDTTKLATSSVKYLFINKIRKLQKKTEQNLASFRGDVPGKSVKEPLIIDDVLDICSVNHLELGDFKVY